eukprot:1028055-Pleurochrysis_carterae.AAC.6
MTISMHDNKEAYRVSSSLTNTNTSDLSLPLRPICCRISFESNFSLLTIILSFSGSRLGTSDARSLRRLVRGRFHQSISVIYTRYINSCRSFDTRIQALASKETYPPAIFCRLSTHGTTFIRAAAMAGCAQEL